MGIRFAALIASLAVALTIASPAGAGTGGTSGHLVWRDRSS